MAQKTWGGRFSEATDELVARLNASVGFDQRLYREDIDGSLAHARMLAAQGILSQEDADKITAGLEAVRQDMRNEGEAPASGA